MAHLMHALFIILMLCKVFTLNDVVFEDKFINESNYTKHIAELILAHTDFETIYHYDSSNKDTIGKIITDVTFLNETVIKSANLISYSAPFKFNNIFNRPLVKQIFNVVLLNNVSHFSKFLNSFETVNEDDEALFVSTKLAHDLTYLNNSQVWIFGKILVMKFDRQGDTTLYSICYFCGKKSGHCKELASTRSSSKKNSFDFSLKSFSDFDAHLFKVAFVPYYPFIWCNKLAQQSICTSASGTEIEMIEVLSRKLNFTYKLKQYSNYKMPLKHMKRNSIDFVIGGISATTERLNKSTCTSQYWFECFHLLYDYQDGLSDDLVRIFSPFDVYLWILFGSSVFLTAAFIYLFNRLVDCRSSCISYSDSFWVCLNTAIEQVTRKPGPKTNTGLCLILATWILLCVNMSTAYKSKLAATIMNPPLNEPNSIEELIQNDYSFIVNEEYKDAFLSLFKNLPKLPQAENYTICNEFKYAVEHHAAILGEYSSLQFELRKNCYISPELQLRITKKHFGILGHVWLLYRRAAFKKSFDQVLGYVMEAGLPKKWKIDYTKNMMKKQIPMSENTTKHEYSPLALKILLSLFAAHGVGTTIAIIVFVVELWLSRKLRLRSKKVPQIPFTL